jgi:hypothetical protein
MIVDALPKITKIGNTNAVIIRHSVTALQFYSRIANQFLYIDELYSKVYDTIPKVVI